MRRRGITLALSVGVWTLVAAVAAAGEKVATWDDCEPVTFNAAIGPGTCADVGGEVTFSEFLSVLPLAGHPAWRNEPSYLKIKPGEKVTVTNEGGENHTFTEVAVFGGGFIPPLNGPLGFTGPVPECGSVVGSSVVPNPDVVMLAPGARLQVDGLDVGTHLFECCIHPWMRAAIKVEKD